MPQMPVLTPEQREREDRFERKAGKLLKDWVSRVMHEHGVTRTDARRIVLDILGRKAAPKAQGCADD